MRCMNTDWLCLATPVQTQASASKFCEVLLGTLQGPAAAIQSRQNVRPLSMEATVQGETRRRRPDALTPHAMMSWHCRLILNREWPICVSSAMRLWVRVKHDSSQSNTGYWYSARSVNMRYQQPTDDSFCILGNWNRGCSTLR